MRSGLMRKLLGAAAVLSCASGAVAGAISVSPTRVALSVRHPVATLEVRNEGADTVTIQMERMAWTQSAGEDVYTASASLIATPTVFELAPHSSQVLRIALREGLPRNGELAFRLYATEVQTPLSPDAGPELQMSLRIGVPIFAESSDGDSRLEGALMADPSGRLTVRLRNAGGHFTRAMRLEIQDQQGSVLWQSRSAAYVLAGGEYRWPIDAHAGSLAASEKLRLSVVTETGVQSLDVQRSP